MYAISVAKQAEFELLTLDGPTGPVEVRVTSPSKPYFSREVQLTKLDIVRYFLSVAPGALNGIRNRPIVLKRFVDGACLSSGNPEPFYQKRAPSDLPAFLRTATLSFPSGRTAEEVVVDNAPGLAWIANLGCVELHPHPITADDLDHPNQLRVDLDPGPGVDWESVKQVALVARHVLEEHALSAWPKTSGSRGMHVNAPIESRWGFTEVRRAALALAREVERRVPALASSKWWKEERHGVFLDYNQNAKDRTTASAYSVRPLPDARVSAPLRWDEVEACDPADFTVLTMPARFAKIGEPHESMDAHPGSLESLLELAARDEASGLGDAPWPPHFAKAEGEGKRVAPSKAKKFSDQIGEGFGSKRFRKQGKSAEVTQPESESIANSSKSSDIENLGQTDHDSNGKQDSKGHGFNGADKQSEDKGAPALEGSTEVPPTRKTRASKQPLLTIAQSPDKLAAEAGLERWKLAHPEAAAHLAVDDVLVDRMRGASTIWYRIRVNLRHVPEVHRPTQQTPDPDDPTRAWRESPQ
jgi:bifunctional non-homologous end joining protein LigD